MDSVTLKEKSHLLKSIMLAKCNTLNGKTTVAQLISDGDKNILDIHGIRLLKNKISILLFPIIVSKTLLKGTVWEGKDIRFILRECTDAKVTYRKIEGFSTRGIAIPLKVMQKAKEDTNKEEELIEYVEDTGIRILCKNGKRLYVNEHDYIHCYHNDELIEVVTSFGNKSYICRSCGEVVKKELTSTSL